LRVNVMTDLLHGIFFVKNWTTLILLVNMNARCLPTLEEVRCHLMHFKLIHGTSLPLKPAA